MSAARVVAPADDRRAVVREEDDRLRLAAYMSGWDVHVSRAPVRATGPVVRPTRRSVTRSRRGTASRGRRCAPYHVHLPSLEEVGVGSDGQRTALTDRRLTLVDEA